MRLLLFLLFSIVITQAKAQEYLYNWPDSLIQEEAKNIVTERALAFNDGINPGLFADETKLLDSLKNNKINHMIMHFDFSAFDQNMDNPLIIAGRSRTMDKEIPFIRYRYDRTELGDITITVIQGHNNW